MAPLHIVRRSSLRLRHCCMYTFLGVTAELSFVLFVHFVVDGSVSIAWSCYGILDDDIVDKWRRGRSAAVFGCYYIVPFLLSLSTIAIKFALLSSFTSSFLSSHHFSLTAFFIISLHLLLSFTVVLRPPTFSLHFLGICSLCPFSSPILSTCPAHFSLLLARDVAWRIS